MDDGKAALEGWTVDESKWSECFSGHGASACERRRQGVQEEEDELLGCTAPSHPPEIPHTIDPDPFSASSL